MASLNSPGYVPLRMTRPSKRLATSHCAIQVRHHHEDPASTDDDSTAPNPIPDPPIIKLKSAKAQILEKDTRITELEVIINGLNTDVLQLQNSLLTLQDTHNALLD
ncbi:hypothetical protein B0H13DRAFT_2387795 [Mycena leptocephala]|nr:hypothetical protein B0H13DRAFT_2387795 [Mycena leptocephala]